jgi:RNA polymerase sigma-70 factor, ECF subfamily
MTEITRKALVEVNEILHAAGWDQRVKSASPTEGPPDALEMSEGERRIDEAVGHLVPELRSVAVMAYIEGKTLENIAEILKVPLGTVKTRMHLARVQLRESLHEPEKPRTSA